jgi:hypothetical protein
MAALEFKPWSLDTIARMNRDFSADHWSLKPDSAAGVDLRIAAAIMSKTKDELAEVARGLDAKVFELLDHLHETAERLQALVDILESARARQQIGAAVVANELFVGGKGKVVRLPTQRRG